MKGKEKLAGWVVLTVCVTSLHAAHSSACLDLAVTKEDCVFPFTYDNTIHHNCTSTHSDYDWCSYDKVFRGRWRFCTGEDPPKCTFPFFFKSMIIYNCTKRNYILNRSWCSLTKNYNQDKKWKQCSPNHL